MCEGREMLRLRCAALSMTRWGLPPAELGQALVVGKDGGQDEVGDLFVEGLVVVAALGGVDA